jgi:hypothetical protein
MNTLLNIDEILEVHPREYRDIENKKVWTIDEAQRKVLLSAIHFVMAMDLYHGHGCTLPPNVGNSKVVLPEELEQAYKKLEESVTVSGLRLPT